MPDFMTLRNKDAQGSPRRRPPIKFMFSESGRVNDDLYARAIDEFAAVWHETHSDGLQCMLFADQLGARQRRAQSVRANRTS